MEVVVDANVLFAGLIKMSTTAVLLFDPSLRIYTAEFVLEEFTKYYDLIKKKTERTEEEFVTMLHMLHQIIFVIPEEEYEKYMDEAKKISPDVKDEMYFALALKLKCGLWSNDKRLKEQDKVKVYSTKEIIDIVF